MLVMLEAVHRSCICFVAWCSNFSPLLREHKPSVVAAHVFLVLCDVVIKFEHAALDVYLCVFSTSGGVCYVVKPTHPTPILFAIMCIVYVYHEFACAFAAYSTMWSSKLSQAQHSCAQRPPPNPRTSTVGAGSR